MATRTSDSFSNAFAHPLSLRRRSPLYHLGMVLTAVVMCALPVIYIALAAGVAVFVVLHAVHNHFVFGAYVAMGAALLYLGPIIAGGLIVILMCKPLFAPRAQDPFYVEVSRSEEPQLWSYVERLCATVSAPVPRVIRIDCQANASASFRRGLLSIAGNDLVLTIGLPLVAGMSLRQLTGVLAHEFGHFSQGGGMRATYIIGRINRWFHRAAYEDDAWDEQLSAASETGIVLSMLIALFARLCIFVTRAFLRVLMYVAHAISCFMSRRMEFDADRFQAAVVGSAEFEPTFRKIIALDIAVGGAEQQARDMWNEGKLPDSMSMLAAHYLDRIPADQFEQIIEQAFDGKQRLFDTHPSTRARIDAAVGLDEPGVFTIDAPATELFQDFHAASVRATYDYFKQRLGPRIMDATFVSTGGVIEEARQEQQASEVAAEFFRNLISYERPVRLTAVPTAPSDPGSAAKSLLRATRAIESRREQFEKARDAVGEGVGRTAELDAAEAMIGAGLKMGAQVFNVTPPNQETIAAERSHLRDSLAPQLALVEESRKLNETRFNLALSLALSPALDRGLSDAKQHRQTIESLVPVLGVLLAVHGSILKLHRTMNRTGGIVHGLRRDEKESGIDAYRMLTVQIAQQLESIREKLDREMYPFEHTDPTMTVGRFLIEQVPGPGDPELASAASGLLDRFSDLLWRVYRELALPASRVERCVRKAAARRKPSATDE